MEWRTILDKEGFTEKHDRWLRIDKALWNVPPFTAVMANKFASLRPHPNAIPLGTWWDEGTELTAVR